MPKRKSLKPIPKFESEDEEREFWATHDSADHLDWNRAKPAVFLRLKPTTQTISLRLPEALLEGAEPPITSEEREVLAARMADIEANPSAEEPWSEAKAWLESHRR